MSEVILPGKNEKKLKERMEIGFDTVEDFTEWCGDNKIAIRTQQTEKNNEKEDQGYFLFDESYIEGIMVSCRANEIPERVTWKMPVEPVAKEYNDDDDDHVSAEPKEGVGVSNTGKFAVYKDVHYKAGDSIILGFKGKTLLEDGVVNANNRGYGEGTVGSNIPSPKRKLRARYTVESAEDLEKDMEELRPVFVAAGIKLAKDLERIENSFGHGESVPVPKADDNWSLRRHFINHEKYFNGFAEECESRESKKVKYKDLVGSYDKMLEQKRRKYKDCEEFSKQLEIMVRCPHNLTKTEKGFSRYAVTKVMEIWTVIQFKCNLFHNVGYLTPQEFVSHGTSKSIEMMENLKATHVTYDMVTNKYELWK